MTDADDVEAVDAAEHFVAFRTPTFLVEGEGPVILSQPHGGTWVPTRVADTLNDTGRELADTDWEIGTLYPARPPLVPEPAPTGWLARTMGRIKRTEKPPCVNATVVAARAHRYVVDCNRPPDGASLYPGQNTTGLCPLTDFDGKPLYRDGMEPDEAETARRLTEFHAPYHAALTAELERVRAKHGVAVLYDCHSIRSRIPFLFEGVLPDFNIGTNGGTTCAPQIEAATVETCAVAGGYSHVLNGRFKGGWTTRHYGRPAEGWHAVQMELAQSTHLQTEEPPFAYDEAKAARLRIHLGAILERLNEIALTGALTSNRGETP